MLVCVCVREASFSSTHVDSTVYMKFVASVKSVWVSLGMCEEWSGTCKEFRPEPINLQISEPCMICSSVRTYVRVHMCRDGSFIRQRLREREGKKSKPFRWCLFLQVFIRAMEKNGENNIFAHSFTACLPSVCECIYIWSTTAWKHLFAATRVHTRR